MPYCENCGTQLNPNANFCGNCGAPQKPQAQPTPQYIPISLPPMAAGIPEPPNNQALPKQEPEKILGFIIANKQKRFGNPEYFTGILTSEQLIFAPMTSDMLKEVSNISRQQAKGKLPASIVYPYQQRILAMAPFSIMAQTMGCFSIQNASIREIKLKIVNVPSDGYSDFQEFEMQILTNLEAQTFHMTKRGEYITLLKQFYQDKVNLS